MAYYLSEINARCRADAAGFIAECDRVYAGRLELAADRIMENMGKSPIVLLSGPSGSGKTTTALKVCEVLERRGVRTHSISMDNYFKTVSPETTPRTPEGKYDLESPLCMDMELLNEHFSVLSEGGRILVPRYDFVHQCRDLEPSASLRLKKNEVAVFEGIHALNDSITLVHPEAFKLYISARSNILDDNGAVVFKGTWMRLLRRLVRDSNFRGTPAAATLDMWANVRRGEKRFISPFKERANLMFDSSFPCEVSIMKNYAAPLLAAVPEGAERYAEIRSTLPALERFETIDPALLAPESMLREFIGGVYSY